MIVRTRLSDKFLSKVGTKETILLHGIAIHSLPPTRNYDEVIGVYASRYKLPSEGKRKMTANILKLRATRQSWQHSRNPEDAFDLGGTHRRLSVLVSGCDQPVYALSFR